MIRGARRGGAFCGSCRLLAVACVALAGEAPGVDPGRNGGNGDGIVEAPPTGVRAADDGPNDTAAIAALRAFQARVEGVHRRQAARAGALAGPSAAENPAEGPGHEPIEEDTGLSGKARLRLRGVLDRLSVSTRWEVEQDSWSAGIRLRYSRSVEYDPATRSYALTEAMEIAPAASFRIVAIGRPTRAVVRRTGYATWEKALLAAPSRWLFVDRPDRAEETLQLAPGTTVTLSNETKLFLGADVSTDLGAFPLRARAGPFASGESFVRLERLDGSVESSGGREWIVSVGGLIPRGFESSMDLRTPDLLWGETSAGRRGPLAVAEGRSLPVASRSPRSSRESRGGGFPANRHGGRRAVSLL